MELRDLIYGIGSGYDRSLPFTSPAQQLLKSARHELAPVVPGGYVVQGSGGRGNTAVVPWIAVFDPDETLTARRGMYLVYLFDAEMETVSLSLNQGVTDVISHYGVRKGRQCLAKQAGAIRDALGDSYTRGLVAAINLKSPAALPVHYEYGNIVAQTYELANLPNSATLEADLLRLIYIYQAALKTRTTLRLTTDDTIVTTSPASLSKEVNLVFKPKSDAEYSQQVVGRTLVKCRKHERLIRDYGQFIIDGGFLLGTNVHPRDLVVITRGEHWLIEAKILYQGDGVCATREALAQLLMYRKFLYVPDQEISLLALFNEDIGLLCRQFLEDYDIVTVLKSGSGWIGSSRAFDFGLCTSTF